MLAGKKLGIIGVGKLGEALVSGLLKESVIRKEDIVGSVHHETFHRACKRTSRN